MVLCCGHYSTESEEATPARGSFAAYPKNKQEKISSASLEFTLGREGWMLRKIRDIISVPCLLRPVLTKKNMKPRKKKCCFSHSAYAINVMSACNYNHFIPVIV